MRNEQVAFHVFLQNLDGTDFSFAYQQSSPLESAGITKGHGPAGFANRSGGRLLRPEPLRIYVPQGPWSKSIRVSGIEPRF